MALTAFAVRAGGETLHATFSHPPSARFADPSVFEQWFAAGDDGDADDRDAPESDVLGRLTGRGRFAGHAACEVGAAAVAASQGSYAKLDARESIALIPTAKPAAAHAARERMGTLAGRDAANRSHAQNDAEATDHAVITSLIARLSRCLAGLRPAARQGSTGS